MLRNSAILKRYFNKDILCITIIYLLTLFIYGIFPGQWSSFPGSVDFGVPSLSISQILYNPKLGYPLGNFYPEGLPYISLRLLLTVIFRISEYTAGQLEIALILLFSIIGVKKLLIQFRVNNYLAILLSFIFVIMPINMGHLIGYPPLSKTLLLVPLLLYIDLYVFSRVNTLKKLNIKNTLLLVFLSFAKCIAMFGNGYGFIFYNFISFCFLLSYVFENKFENIRSSILLFVSFIVANIVAVLLYKLYIPGGASYYKESIDFFRAQGVDLYTMIVPGNNLFFLKTLNLSKHWEAYKYYGDGSNVYFNYIGYTFILLLIIALSKRFLKKTIQRILVPILLVSTIISFGPSLKVNDTRDMKAGDGLSYHMKESDATLSLGTSFIYELPAIKNMRSVYRWIYITKLILLIISGIVLTELLKSNKNKKYVWIISCLILLEFFPGIKGKIYQRKNFYKMGMQFSEDVTSKLEPYMKKDQKVYIYSHANDFLAKIIGNRYESYLYNINGDKKMGLVREQWPKSILKISKTGYNLNEYVYTALSSDDLDVFILPNFNLRWDFYYWPPSKDKVEEINKEYESKFNFNDPRFKINKHKYFTVVELSGKTSNVLEIDSTVSLIDKINYAEFIGQGDMDCPWGKRISAVNIKEENRAGIFSAPASNVIFTIDFSSSNKKYMLNTSVGFYPESKKWNVSDGARMQIIIENENLNDTVFNEYILPENDFREINISFSKYINKVVKLRFETIQDTNKNYSGDWLVWLDPKLVSN